MGTRLFTKDSNMLKQVLLLAVTGLVLGQRIPDWFRPYTGTSTYRLDTIHGHTMEYDDLHDLILLVGKDNCYLVEAPDNTWDSIVQDKDHIPEISEDIYHQITSKTGVTQMTHTEATNEFHSRLEQWQCRSKYIFKVAYTPSSA